MQIIDLGGQWTLRRSDETTTQPAFVPGCVHQDLLESGRIPDWNWRDDEDRSQWVMEHDWIYERTIHLAEDFLAAGPVALVCDGLDTLAEVRVNDVVVLEADNMFRTWEVTVDDHLVVGDNRIAVRFRSVLPALAAGQQRQVLPQWNQYDERFAGRGWVRKMACAYGWDWGPKVVTAGIWKDIALVARGGGRIDEVRLAHHHHPDGAVTLTATVRARASTTAHCAWSVEHNGVAVANGSSPVEGRGSGFVVRIADPHHWWPAGFGPQNLYTITVRLLDAEGGEQDVWRRRTGVRTLVVAREPDEWGESFAFTVNGQPFFAKGANWIPLRPCPTMVTRAMLERILDEVVDSNMNMLRVWGGGIYESDDFYDLCDERGICIWQDFMFACGTYPAFDEDFLDNVEVEARQQVARLRHHPSIALWCGNNELEQGLVADEWNDHQMSWRDYVRLFDRLLPSVVAEVDGERSYWPCSPHTPYGDRRQHGDERCGDAHNWGVWFGWQPIESQRQWQNRFMSEFGFQSFPDPATIARWTEPGDRNLSSWVMDFHQRSQDRGNKTILAYLADWFRIPSAFDDLVYATQMIHAWCVEVAVDHVRRIQPRNMGILYWQLDDMWFAASWASIDGDGRWKALQYVARRCFEPVHLSILEDDGNASFALHVSNHRRDPVAVDLVWRLHTCSGDLVEEGTVHATIASQANAAVAVVAAASALVGRTARDLVLSAEVMADGVVVSRNWSALVRPKHLVLEDPGLETSIDEVDGEFVLRVSVARPAPWTRFAVAGSDLRFADNFCHLFPGQPRTIAVADDDGLSLEEIRDGLVVRPLVGIA